MSNTVRRLGLARLAFSPLSAVVALTFVHGLLFAALVPPWQAPDETTHYEYLRALAAAPDPFSDHLVRSREVRLVVVASARVFEWWDYVRMPDPFGLTIWPGDTVFYGRSASLYYWLAMPIYLVVRDWSLPGQLYALRAYSVVWQCLTVWLTYRLACELFPDPADWATRLIPLIAALFVALFPMYAFMSATFNDDNLVPVWTTAALVALLRGLRIGGDWRWLLLALGGALLALLSKRTGLPVLLLVGVGVLFYSKQWAGSRHRLARLAAWTVWGGLALGLALGLAMVLNPPRLPDVLLYWLRGTPDMVGQVLALIQHPTQLAALDWAASLWFWQTTFWGSFGWLRANYAPETYALLTGVWAVLMIGIGMAWVRHLRVGPATQINRYVAWGTVLLSLGLVLSALVLVIQYVLRPSYGLNARYMFPMLGAFACLAVWGWQSWWPRRWAALSLVAGIGLLIVFDAAAIVLTVIPYFYS